jgi:hypothetical protein
MRDHPLITSDEEMDLHIRTFAFRHNMDPDSVKHVAVQLLGTVMESLGRYQAMVFLKTTPDVVPGRPYDNTVIDKKYRDYYDGCISLDMLRTKAEDYERKLETRHKPEITRGTNHD